VGEGGRKEGRVYRMRGQLSPDTSLHRGSIDNLPGHAIRPLM